MTRREPFVHANIAERSTWPESKAALRGPDSYNEFGALDHKQRGELVRLAKVEADREKPFIDSVTGAINVYRLRRRCRAQESPAAVAESMRQLIEIVDAYKRKVLENPLHVMLKPPLPSDDWFEHAKEILRRKERLVNGHRPRRLTEALIMHAWTLQKVARVYSDHLAYNRKEMIRWLWVALIASGERLPGKNSRKDYLEGLMLPQAPDGSVDLTGRPPALIALVE